MAVRDPLAALSERVQDELAKQRLTQIELSKRTGIRTDTLSRMLSGTNMGTTLEMLFRLGLIERDLGLRAGDLLRVMGFVKDPQSTRESVQSEPSLGPPGREAVLVLFDHYSRPEAAVSKLPVRKAAAKGKVPRVKAGKRAEIEEQVRKRAPGAPNRGDDASPGRRRDPSSPA